MNTLTRLSLALFFLTQPLTIAARGAGGGGGHGHAHRSQSRRHSHAGEGHEEGRDSEGRPIEVQITVPGPPADIPQICSSSNDTDFCVKTLTENPGSKDKDQRQMSLLALEMARNKGAEVSAAVTQRLQNKGNVSEAVSNALDVFADRYNETLGNLDQAVAALSAADIPFDDIKHWIAGGMTNAQVCGVAIIEAKPDDVALQGEEKSNDEFYKLCDNALSVVTAFQFVTWANKQWGN